LSCNGSGLARTSSSAGKKLAGFEAFMDAAQMDESGVALNGEADMTSKPRAGFLAGLPGNEQT
jgi:hypothetical protein